MRLQAITDLQGNAALERGLFQYGEVLDAGYVADALDVNAVPESSHHCCNPRVVRGVVKHAERFALLVAWSACSARGIQTVAYKGEIAHDILQIFDQLKVR